MKYALCLLLPLVLLAGCATPPSPILDAARTEVDALRSDNQVVDSAPIAVAEAEDALLRAETAENLEERNHQASLASIRVQVARARAEQRRAEQRADQAAKRAEEIQMEARGREARAAQSRAAEAERRAALLRSQAQAERRRAEQARQLASRAQAELAEVQNQLAELKPRLSDRGLVLTLGEVLFDFDSATLKPYTERIIDRLADFLQQHQDYTLAIEGHTDSTGTAQYNQELSGSRAKSVADSLARRGVGYGRMQVRGLGEIKPIASNTSDEGRRQNRRVEVIIQEP